MSLSIPGLLKLRIGRASDVLSILTRPLRLSHNQPLPFLSHTGIPYLGQTYPLALIRSMLNPQQAEEAVSRIASS